MPIGTRSIGYDAFSDCVSLKRIAFPKDLSEIEDMDIFSGCDALTDISFGGGREEWDILTGGKVLSHEKSNLDISTPKVTFMNLK